MNPPSQNFTRDGSTMLLIHFDDYGVGRLRPFTASNGSPFPFSTDVPGIYGDDSGHSNFLDEVQSGGGCVGCSYYSGPTYFPYSLGQGITADEVTGGNCRVSASAPDPRLNIRSTQPQASFTTPSKTSPSRAGASRSISTRPIP